MRLERLSIELTNRCSKACPFCYNRSHPQGQRAWDSSSVVSFIRDRAANGLQAVSFGGEVRSDIPLPAMPVCCQPHQVFHDGPPSPADPCPQASGGSPV